MRTQILHIRTLTSHGVTLALLLTLWGARVSAQYDLLYLTPGDPVNWSRTLAVADDGAGNAFIAGEFKNTMTLGEFTLTNFPLPTDPDNERVTGFIAKYNSNSATWLWATQIVLLTYTAGSIPNLSSCSIMDITRDNAGNIYITGSYYGRISLGNTTLTSLKQGAYPTIDIFVAKLNANGSFSWAKSLGSKDGDDLPYTIALDGSNNVVIGGLYASKSSTCGWGLSARDIYVAKLANAGQVLWEKKFKRGIPACGSSDLVRDLAIDASGSILICGSYSGTFSFGNGSSLSITSINGTSDAFVAKLNSSGATQWVKSAGGTGTDDATAIHNDASGNVYIAGGYGAGTGGGIAFGNLSLPATIGGSDPFVAKYNASGTPLWAVNPDPEAYSIKRIAPYSGALLIADGRIGFQTLSLADGTTLSTIPFEGNGPIYFNPDMTGLFTLMDLEVAGSGYLFTLIAQCGTISIGGTILNATCDDCSVDCNGLLDNFLVRTGSGGLIAPPIEENPLVDLSVHVSHEGFTIFPNPASDEAHVVRHHPSDKGVFTFTDQLGRIVHIEYMQEGQTEANISLQHMISGVYFVSSTTMVVPITQPLLITR